MRRRSKEVESILHAFGMDIPTAVRMYFRKVVEVGGIPFDLRDERLASSLPQKK